MKKILFFCLMIHTMAVCAESIGVVLSTVGKVVAKHAGGGERTLSRGSSISTGDSIVTGSGAKAQIKYTNGTIVTIDANSDYQTLSYAPKSDVSIKSSLKHGSMAYNSNAKTHKKKRCGNSSSSPGRFRNGIQR